MAKLFTPLKKKKKGRGESHVEQPRNYAFLLQTLTHIAHRSPFSAAKWTSLVGSRQPSSSVWRCCGRGLPGTSVSFPSFFAGPCMPAHSPGTAGRSTRPEARSYSSTYFRTAKGQQGCFSSWSGDVQPPGTGPDFPVAASCHVRD